MEKQLSRGQLIELVKKIIHVEGTEDEIDQWVVLVANNVPHPEVSGLLFWPNMYGLGNNPSATEIVDKALSHKAIQL